MRLSRLPITLKLVLTFVGMALVVFACGGYLVGHWVQDLVEEERSQAFAERSRHLADRLAHHLNQTELAAAGLRQALALEPEAAPARQVELCRHWLPGLSEVVLQEPGQARLLWSARANPSTPALPLAAESLRLGHLESSAGQAHMALALDLPGLSGADRRLWVLFPPEVFLAGLVDPEQDPHTRKLTLHTAAKGLLSSWSPSGQVEEPPAATAPLMANRVSLGDRDLLLEVSQPARSLSGKMATAQSRFLGVALVAALVCLLFVFFPLRFLVRPLRSLTETARRLQQGDLSARVSIESNDEVGALAETFNDMAGTLQRQTEHLQDTASALNQKTQQLKLERDRIDTAVRHMPDGLLFLDEKCEVIMTNQEGEVLTDLIGLANLEQRVRTCPTGTPDNCHSCLMGTEKKQSACLMESGGRIYEVLSTLLGTPEQPRGKILLSRDITERVAMDEQQAHQERLSVLGILSAVVAHEINNPLSAISMYAQMLEDELPEASSFREHTEVIRRNILTCKNTIRSLLDHAQTDAPEPVEMDLHDVLEDVVRFMKPLAKKSRVHLILETEAPESWIRAEEGGLRQVLINLFMNGIQAMDPEGGELSMATRQDTGGFLVLDIRDTGRGIPDNLKDKIFEPFFTTKGPGKGTGLGLPTTVRILESMGGHLTLIETGETGTHFQVRLQPVAAPGLVRPLPQTARSTP